MKTGELTEAQHEVMEEVPPMYQGVFLRAFTGNSRQAGIKAFCLRCVGYTRMDVQNCTALKCPLYPYQSADEPEVEP